MRRKNDSETSLWISTTDLMSGMLVIFLFIAVVMTQNYNTVVQKSNEAQQELQENINREFTEEERQKYNLENVDEGVGYAEFKKGDSRFKIGSAELDPNFKSELKEFLPKYIRAVAKCNPETITEVRIEGHTSSEWRGEVLSVDEIYIKNMELSQARTRAILEFALSLPELEEYKDFMKEKLTANGLSSSKLKRNKDGSEDKEASRRIEFRTIADDAKTMKELKRLWNEMR